MRTISSSTRWCAVVSSRSLCGFVFCSMGMFLAMFSFAKMPSKETTDSSTRNTSLAGGTRSAPAASAAATGPTTNLSNGITFDHGMIQDPVVILGEPDIAFDTRGGIYVSGPGGSPTQTSWFWKSDDKGIQWHSVGCIPIGKPNCQNGGGDTEIAIAKNNDVFASDLQTLQCNSTFRSYDAGKTFDPGEGCFPETDRQWMVVYDPNASATGRRIYLSANELALGCYVLVSTDNGVTYLPTQGTGIIPGGPDCIGRFAVNPTNGHLYVPVSGGTRFSSDGGVTWVSRAGSGAQG